MKKPAKRAGLLLLLAVGVLAAALLLAPWVMNRLALAKGSSVAIIGSADGPTAIWIQR